MHHRISAQNAPVLLADDVERANDFPIFVFRRAQHEYRQQWQRQQQQFSFISILSGISFRVSLTFLFRQWRIVSGTVLDTEMLLHTEKGINIKLKADLFFLDLVYVDFFFLRLRAPPRFATQCWCRLSNFVFNCVHIKRVAKKKRLASEISACESVWVWHGWMKSSAAIMKIENRFYFFSLCCCSWCWSDAVHIANKH